MQIDKGNSEPEIQLQSLFNYWLIGLDLNISLWRSAVFCLVDHQPTVKRTLLWSYCASLSVLFRFIRFIYNVRESAEFTSHWLSSRVWLLKAEIHRERERKESIRFGSNWNSALTEIRVTGDHIFHCGRAEPSSMLTLAYEFWCNLAAPLVFYHGFKTSTILPVLSDTILSLHTSMLKSKYPTSQCWFRQGSVAIYWGIVTDSGLVKSYFVLWAWSSASSGLVKVEDGAGMPTGDPKSSPIFHPYCPWHIQSGRAAFPRRDRRRERGRKSVAAQRKRERAYISTSYFFSRSISCPKTMRPLGLHLFITHSSFRLVAGG